MGTDILGIRDWIVAERVVIGPRREVRRPAISIKMKDASKPHVSSVSGPRAPGRDILSRQDTRGANAA